MSFYVFNATPMGRARIHKGSCIHCRDGQGQENQEKNGSGATGWSEPLATVVEAERYMAETFPRFKDTGKCQVCKPGVE